MQCFYRFFNKTGLRELDNVHYSRMRTVLSETMEGLRDKFLKWKETCGSKGYKVNHGKIRVMVCGGISKDGMSKSKVDPWWNLQLESKG